MAHNAEGFEKVRALRRHHRKRILLKRYKRVERGRWYVKSPGHLAKNNTVCSCYMCGNPRKRGEITRQEKLADFEWHPNGDGSGDGLLLAATSSCVLLFEDRYEN